MTGLNSRRATGPWVCKNCCYCGSVGAPGFADQVAAPTANFASGELEMGTEITFSTETDGASIYYRTDGMDPNPDEKTGLTLYTGPISVEKAVTFKVIAVKNQMPLQYFCSLHLIFCFSITFPPEQLYTQPLHHHSSF